MRNRILRALAPTLFAFAAISGVCAYAAIVQPGDIIYTGTLTYQGSQVNASGKPTYFQGAGIDIGMSIINPDNSNSELKHAITINENVSGTSGSTSAIYNQINTLSDTVAVPSGVLATPVMLNSVFGGAGMTGNRTGLLVSNTQTATSSNPIPSIQSYGAISAEILASVNDNGTGNTISTAGGQYQAVNWLARASGTATHLYQLSGEEINVEADTGSSMYEKIGLAIVEYAADAVHGTTVDAAINLANQTGAEGWNTGILLGRADGAWPFASGASFFGCYNPSTSCGSMATLIDLANVTFTSNIINLPGYTVTQTGAVAATGVLSKMLTVATLPTCNSSIKGEFFSVSDATTPAYNATLTGGGAVVALALCNGTAWTAH